MTSTPSGHTHRPNLSRRLFVGSGLSLALPILSNDVSRASETGTVAASSINPQRMVCVANPLGFVPDGFFPDDTGPQCALPRLLEPLEPLRDRFTVFSHLDHGVTGGHQGVHAFLSGIRDNESVHFENRNQSVDQKAAAMVGSETRFPSIVASVGANSGELECRTSWTATGVNVPPVTTAGELFSALFVDEDTRGRQTRHQQIRRHRSVLDAVAEQARGMSRDLGKTDRDKLDEYLTSIRGVERKLTAADRWLDRPKPDVDLDHPPNDAAFTRRLPLFYELFRLALMTDSTRVATLAIPGNLPVADLGLRGNYHAFSHHGKSSRLLEPLLQIEKFQVQQFARFLQSLRDTPVADGSRLLDHTTVLMGSGMGNASSHSNKNLPVLLAGGSHRHATHVRLPKADHLRVPMCNLFTTMLQTFSNDEVDSFNTSTGTLTW